MMDIGVGMKLGMHEELMSARAHTELRTQSRVKDIFAYPRPVASVLGNATPGPGGPCHETLFRAAAIEDE